MRAARVAPVLSLLVFGTFACQSAPRGGTATPDELKERAQRYEARYHMNSGDARFAATRHPTLDTDVAYSTYATLAKRLGIERLALEDGPTLEDLAQLDEAKRAKIVADATSDVSVELVKRLRDAGFGYDFRIKEIEVLGRVDPKLVDRATSAAFVAAARTLHERQPAARFPLVAIDPSIELADVTPDQLKGALDRFAVLEIDLGVREWNVRSLDVLVFTARRPRALDALSTMRRRLRDFDIAAVTSQGLEIVAAVGQKSLDETLSETVATRFGRHTTTLDERWARAVATLAAQPGAGAVLSLLDAELPELLFSDESDARAVARIASVGSQTGAVAALAPALRAGAVVDSLDNASVNFLCVLVSEPPVLEVVKSLHGAWPTWHATPDQLPALRVLVGAANLTKLCLTLERRLGFELGSTLSGEVAGALAQLARDDATAMADSLHLVFPRLKVQDATALHEIHELIAAGVTPADILRLDVDSFSGNFGPRIRSSLVAKARPTH